MKLISLHLKNWRAHRDTFIGFPAVGIIGLIGPSEAGKSSILEAITCGLFGSKAIRGAVDGVKSVTAHAKLRAELDLVVELDGERMRIVRTVGKDPSAMVYVGDAEIPAAATVTAVDAYLLGRIGLSRDEWSASFLSAQKDLMRLTSMRAGERRSFVLDVMGISRIERALDACRKRKNVLKNELDGMRIGLGEREPIVSELDSASGAEVDAKQHLADVTDRGIAAARAWQGANDAADAVERVKAEHDAADRRRAEAQANVNATRIELERLAHDLSAAQDAQAKLRFRELELQPLQRLRTERDSLVAAAAAASEAETLMATIEHLRKDLAKLDGWIAECEKATRLYDAAAFEKAADSYRAGENRLNELTHARRNAHAAAIAEHRAAIQKREQLTLQLAKVEGLGADGPCPTCTHPLGEHFADVIATLRDNLQRIEATEHASRELALTHVEQTDAELGIAAELEALKEEIEALRILRTNAKQAAESLPNWSQDRSEVRNRLKTAQDRLITLPDVSANPERLVLVKAEITRLEKIDGELNELRTVAGRVDLLADQREVADRRMDDYLGHVAQAAAAIEDIGFDASEYERIRDALGDAMSALSTAREAAATAKAKLHAATERRTRAEQALEAYDARAAQLNAIADKVRLHEQAEKRLDAFRVAAAGTLRPEMEEIMSGYVSILTDGRHESVTITEDFEVICQEGGVDMPVISGGAEDIVALAQRVAMSQMLAERRGKPLSLLVLDEPFMAQDEIRRAGALAFLRRLGEMCPQLILISHVEETKWTVDYAISVEHDALNMCSRVVTPVLNQAAVAELAEVA